MEEIAALLAEGIQTHGMPCEVAVDQLPAMTTPATLQLVVAPHEFFPLFLVPTVGPEESARLGAQTWVINVEQPGSAWFELAWHHAQNCLGVFDISLEGVEEFRRRGRYAVHAPLGYSGSLEHRPHVDHAERPVDVLFIGHSSPKRDRLLADLAEDLAPFNFRIVLTDVATPRRSHTPGYESGMARTRLFGSTKVVVNIHSTDRQYFETHRAMHAFANRCLLVTETSRRTAPLLSGQHFVMAPAEDLPRLCRNHLNDLATLGTIAGAGHDLAQGALHIAHTGLRILKAAEQSSGRSVTRFSTEDQDRSARLAAIERLNLSRAHRAQGSGDWEIEFNLAAARASGASVSVIVSVFNYSQHVRACLASVEALIRSSAGSRCSLWMMRPPTRRPTPFEDLWLQPGSQRL